MTTYELIYGGLNATYLPLLIIATIQAAYNISNEAPETDNHANRLAWANNASRDPRAQALALQGYVAQYVASQETLDQATVQAGVDASIGKVIPAAV